MPIATSSIGRWQGRLVALPPGAWVLALAAALWPHWRWAAARVADGSDDPLGLAALAAFGALAARDLARTGTAPHGPWWTAALLATAGATAAHLALPPLAGALLAALAVACGVRACMPPGRPAAPLLGLAVLALPVVSSLQFYAGFPLRVVTAQASTWLLQAAGIAAERSGTAMVVAGRLVVVDAPCSGVQMVWMAYFCACAVAGARGLADRRFVARLPVVGGLVLAGNVLRNTVLVALEGTGRPAGEALHQGLGLAVLAAVCAGVVAAMAREDVHATR